MSHYYVDKKLSIKIHPKQKTNERPLFAKDDYILLAKYSSLGYYLVVPLLLGTFVGFALDNYFKTKPFFVLSGIIVGVISTTYNLYKLIKDEQK